jgi:hypothetical protein
MTSHSLLVELVCRQHSDLLEVAACDVDASNGVLITDGQAEIDFSNFSINSLWPQLV